MDRLLRFPLAPLLAAQALWVVLRAERLPEPPGPRSGQSGTGEPLRLLILGDSSSAGVGAETQARALSGQLAQTLAPHVALDWCLEGETGATTQTSLAKLDSLPDRAFDIALLIHGVNDTTRLTSPARFRARQIALMDALAVRHGIQRFILSGVPPMAHFPLLPQPMRWMLGCHAARLDEELAQLASERPEVDHLPLALPFEPHLVARDGFHPSEAAYALWAEMLVERILA
ncbi:MAG: SGNH/GDSL hydrolase family protein [Rhodobacteraceae bacterium]|nr:SGNH/GDSL hydrolase family protein [Paracoccaceae bacterium]